MNCFCDVPFTKTTVFSEFACCLASGEVLIENKSDSCLFLLFSLEKGVIGAILVKIYRPLKNVVIELWFTQVFFEEE